MKVEDITEEVLDNHIDNIIDIVKSIKKNKVTVLVGANGTGKSLIRKQMAVRFMKEFEDNKTHCRTISMQLRTELRSDWGALACMGHDNPDEPTSLSSFDLLKSVMNYDMEKSNDYFIILDEVEIGMAKESVLGIAKYLNEKIPEWLKNSLGVLIITHSDILAKEIYDNQDCDFINLGYNTVNYDINAWINREIVPTDFSFLSEWSSALFHRVNDRSRSVK